MTNFQGIGTHNTARLGNNVDISPSSGKITSEIASSSHEYPIMSEGASSSLISGKKRSAEASTSDHDNKKLKPSIPRSQTYDRLNLVFNHKIENGGENIGVGTQAEIHTSQSTHPDYVGKPMAVKIFHSSQGFNSALTEMLVSRYIKQLNDPELSNRVNLAVDFAISRGSDFGGNYTEPFDSQTKGPLAIITSPKMDSDLRSFNAEITTEGYMKVMQDLKDNVFNKLEDKGLVHNDIKGDNILVKIKENDEHEYRVTDFGCAHLIPGSEAESAFSDIWQELKRELTQNNEINREKLENIKLDDIIPSYDPIDPDDISDYSDFESETESNQSSKRI